MRRFFKIAGRVVLVLLVAVVVVVAGALLWLRSHYALDIAVGQAVSILRDNGFELEVSGVDGHLPTYVSLVGVTLSDKNGPFLRAAGIDLRIDLAPLLRGRLVVEELRLDAPELVRMPDLPKSSEPEAPKEDGGEPFTLPVAVYVDNFVLSNVVVRSELLRELGVDLSGVQFGEYAVLGLSASASASFSKDRQLVSLDLAGSAGFEVMSETVDVAYSVRADLAGTELIFEHFALSAAGMDFTTNASMRLDDGALRARFNLSAKNGTAWQRIAAKFAGFAAASAPVAPSTAAPLISPGSPVPAVETGKGGAVPPKQRALEAIAAGIGGELELSGFVALPGTGAASGNPAFGVRLKARDMSWPDPALDRMIGPEIDMTARAAGGKNNSWTLRLSELRTQTLQASAEGELIREAVPPVLTNAAPAGAADPAAAVPAAQSQRQPASAPKSLSALLGIAPGAVSLKASLDIGDLAPFLSPEGENGGISGPVNVSLDLRGSVDFPHLSVSVESPKFQTERGGPARIALNANAAASVKNAKLALSGDISAQLDDCAGDAALSANWLAGLPLEGKNAMRRLEIGVDGFMLRAIGLEARADVKGLVRLPGKDKTSPASPALLTGGLEVKVIDWETFNALSGMRLSASEALLKVALSGTGGSQNADMEFGLDYLLLPNPEDVMEPTFALRNVKGVLSARDIFSTPSIDFTLDAGQGGTAMLSWDKAEVRVNGDAGTGGFSVSLQKRGWRGARSGSAGKNSPGEPRGRDRSGRPNSGRPNSGRSSKAALAQTPPSPAVMDDILALAGSYDLSRPAVTLDKLFFSPRRHAASLELARPVVVDMASGLSAKGLEVKFTPGGSLTADAEFAPGKLALSAHIDDLPFKIFSLFTSAALPDGKLQAAIDFSSRNGRPQGDFTIRSYMSATQSVSGVGKNDGNGAQGDAKNGASQNLLTDSVSGIAAFDVIIEGSIGRTPDTPAVRSAGVRSMPGVIWLNGKGSLGSLDRSKETKEGKLAMQIPMRVDASGIPSPDLALPFAASLVWDGPINSLWQAVPAPDTYLTGDALINLAVTGSLGQPKPELTAYIAGGSFEDVLSGLLISGINLEAKSTADGKIFALMRADDQHSGLLAMEANVITAGKSPSINMRAQLNKFSPVHRDDMRISLSGILGVNGPFDKLDVTGEIMVDNGEVLLSQQMFAPSVTTLEIETRDPLSAQNGGSPAQADRADTPASSAPPAADQQAGQAPGEVNLALRVIIPDEFFIRGMGLESEWQGDLAITGTAARPSLSGSLSPVRGYLDLFSRTFTLSSGDISFTGGMNLNPALNLELTYVGQGFTAYVRAKGSGTSPKLELESRPPQPQDEILAMILFGKRISELSRFEAIQLADSMRQLMGIGSGTGLDVLANMRRKTGLDMLRVGGGDQDNTRHTSGQAGESNLTGPTDSQTSNSGPTLEAGKYINESIYVGVEQGITQESTAVRVEIELLPNVTLQGKSSSTASEVGIGWKMDY